MFNTIESLYIAYYRYIIPHLHNLFLFQCDVTRSFTRYESPEETVY